MKKKVFFKMFKHLFDYDGKVNRHDFIIDYLIFLIISLILIIFNCIIMMNLIKNDLSFGKYYFNREALILFEVFGLCLIIMFLCSSLLVRRINDIGVSKKIFLFLLIPFLGFVYISLVCLILKDYDDSSIQIRKKLTKRIFFINLSSYIFLLLFGVVFLLIKYGEDELLFRLEILEPTYILDRDINNYNKYNSFYDDYNLMPELSEFGQYNSIQYACKLVSSHAFFSLKIEFDDEKFDDAKNTIDNYYVTVDNYKYSYIEDEISYNNKISLFPVAKFSYKGFDFKILPVYYKSYFDGLMHCEENPFLMVGTNVEDKSFIFLYWFGKTITKTSKNKSEKFKIARMNKTCDYFYWFN